ncbi:NosL family protein [Halalkaliarchaeum sp. AArc-CO]|uniref:nitrous oxide reductase accessory protein NosL n=1 Tax=unclassified Halalkaliarchaeum TaxID=2678344 RepID=UPI00217D4996|nr:MULTISPECIES: nitrous oxide reductase accessory protein NosL [unclassified Halalkaliarchaeum]MDR5673081.1 nitrous oxide reductase accessory protein NosL [Halalkaliarchaeum sp. AArc-GB]UWG49556.1 NosL family protein [Halalkaliarchaeum sp. AArc-CO]
MREYGPATVVTRRRLLSGAAAAATLSVGGLAGCLGSEVPEPVALDGDQSCDQCGMVISEHPGPAGQTYFEGDVPEGRDGPAWFCSSKCSYNYVFDADDRGETPQVTYLTDYSAVDYGVEGEGDSLVITAHLEPEAFADASGLVLVAGSDVEGAMGSAVITFSDGDDAEAFAADYGGDVVPHAEVTRELLAGL